MDSEATVSKSSSVNLKAMANKPMEFDPYFSKSLRDLNASFQLIGLLLKQKTAALVSHSTGVLSCGRRLFADLIWKWPAWMTPNKSACHR